MSKRLHLGMIVADPTGFVGTISKINDRAGTYRVSYTGGRGFAEWTARELIPASNGTWAIDF